MATFQPIKDTKANIDSLPIIDGQLLITTDQTTNNEISVDDGSTRTLILKGINVDSSLSTTSTNAIANNAITNSIVNTLAEVNSITASNIPCGTLAVKELNTNLNGGTATVIPNTGGSFSLDTTFPNDARYNSARKLIKLFAKRSIVFGTGAYTQVATLTDVNMTPTKDQYTPVYSMANGVQVGMAKYLISGSLQVFLFTELPANTTFYTQFDY